MRALALVALVALTAHAQRDGRFERTNSRTPQGRSDRGFLGDSYAFLEFAPASGAGMGAVCACTTPTGAKGEAMTFARASTATCTKTAAGGLATSGIADGDLVTCASGQPRVEYDSAGVLGLLVESARTNVLLRSDALTNAAWADVGTPNATDGATDPFGGTTGDTLTDNAAGAFEGRSQAVTVSAATAYIMSCYIKGTTSAKARLSLDGTTCDATGLSSTTWSLLTCADASSSGVSISAQVLVGNAVGDTGDIVVGGCQVEAGTYATSYMATGAASAARLADSAGINRSLFSTSTGASLAVTVYAPSSGSPVFVRTNASGDTSNRLQLDSAGLTSYVGRYNVAFAGPAPSALGTSRASGAQRVAVSWDGVDTAVLYAPGAAPASATSAKTGWTIAEVSLGATGAEPDGVVSRVCIDPSSTRCR